jgi:hypothetical protein
MDNDYYALSRALTGAFISVLDLLAHHATGEQIEDVSVLALFAAARALDIDLTSPSQNTQLMEAFTKYLAESGLE